MTAPAPALIRDARPEDRPTLVGFMAALQDHERAMEPNRTPGAEMADTHLAALETWAAESGGGILVAEAGGRPVGFLVYGTGDELGTYVPPETRRVGELSDLWIDPAHRGRGLARALILEAEARLRAAGIRRVEVGALPANAEAVAAYRALGYADALLSLAKPL